MIFLISYKPLLTNYTPKIIRQYPKLHRKAVIMVNLNPKYTTILHEKNPNNK